MRNVLSLLTGAPNRIFLTRGDFTNLYLANGIRPVGVLDFARGVYVGSGGRVSDAEDVFTYSDGSGKTMFDATGTLVTVAQGTPRYNSHVYENGSWVNKGLLIESEARTNLITDNSDISGRTLSSAVLVPNYAGSPLGPNTAIRLIDNESTGAGQVYMATPVVNVAVASSYTYYGVFKADQETVVAIATWNFTTPDNTPSYFDLFAGTVQSTNTGHTAHMSPLGNGWYLCGITFTTDATDTSGEIRVYVADENLSVDHDGTSSILFAYDQFEAGSTPSSYIPTSGSTVTRAAETAVIEPANNPLLTAGVNIIANGTFDTTVDEWSDTTSTGTGGISWSGGKMVLVCDNTSNRARASQAISTVIGRRYLATYNSTQNHHFRAGLAENGTANLSILNEGSGEKAHYFIASATTTFVTFEGFNPSASQPHIDNVSVIPLSMPDALSIGMKGTMTGASSTFINWTADADNGLLVQSGASDLTFTQEAVTVVDTVTGGTYTSGINVPFNIASRHGATFINGAVDGTALTADLTPTALADLSAVNFQIGPTFMGHIQELPLYADNVADIGLEEITA